MSERSFNPDARVDKYNAADDSVLRPSRAYPLPEYAVKLGGSEGEIDEPDPREAALATEFKSLVEGLSVAELVQPLPGRKKPKNLADYRFISLVASSVEHGSPSDTPGDYWYEFPKDVTYNDPENMYGEPYLDTSFAIGLVYRNALAAIASAHVRDKGLTVAQIQGANGDASDPQKKYKTDLFGGFYWRDTLVRAWMEVARSLGEETIAIQGAENNRYMTDARRITLTKGYDMVARRMGFTFHPGGDGNWHFELLKAPISNEPVPRVLPKERAWSRWLPDGLLE